ncbi:MAG: Ppx/GppA family phosphatase [Burkholderiaceae bacterium]|jgi:exopolyphosphatase/guanosine-5'-triphosphate,3'-diphosphate pyrophosphatase|nr:Ppx/GppA family phosphatase [Burkholderiaceae bacterium]
MQNGTRLAAIDIGSNSFRLEISAVDHGQIQRVEYIKDTVRLGNGLDATRNLTPEAMRRGWDALARFAERLANFKHAQVRAVATQTLREARNREEFLLRARTTLGFGIDVIPGREEARLIYLGVAHLLPRNEQADGERRLVVDIGGRSTELALGRALEPQTMDSYRLGSVAWSMKYFPQGQFSSATFRAAEVAAKAVLEEALPIYPRDQWDVAYGASGTIGAVGDVLAAAGGTPGVITRTGLDDLIGRLIRAGSTDKVRIEGLREDRKPVIGGGVSVLRALMDLLEIDQMQVAQGALRHGLLHQLLDRDAGVTDLRETTVERLSARFVTDPAQAARVAHTAQMLYLQLRDSAETQDTAERPQDAAGDGRRSLRKLRWAAVLHEAGVQISHTDYHKHGAYIIDHCDAPGFTLDDMHQLSQLILGHRGKLHKIEIMLNDADFVMQLLALRLAVLLCHARRDPQPQALHLARRDASTFEIQAHADWAAHYPQSMHLLREEAFAWHRVGRKLRVLLVN